MSPRSFEEAQELADCFKVQHLVIVNLQNVDRELSKRIVDFCAGLTYGLDGAVWPIGNRIFLLAPSSVEVLEEKDKQAAKRMFFNQL